MTHGSLFSGIGGFDLAAEWMGWENVFHCEWNEFGKKVLNYYWPNAISYDDITKTDFTIHRGTIDVLSGGFPCQPYSLAGKRKGKEDDRHLWPEMLRAIREISPEFVVGENVYGLVNWNGGMVFDEVQADLENEGYEVTPVILPACGQNAPHRRERIWFVAYSISNGHQLRRFREDRQNEGKSIGTKKERQRVWSDIGGIVQPGTFADAHSRRQPRKEYRQTQSRQFTETGLFDNWQNFPTQSPICGGDDGIPTQLDGITFPKWRNESIKGYGNAVVPQIPYQIFKAIDEFIKQS